MKYQAFDIETTGLNPNICQPLGLALVLEDTDHPETPIESLPYFACIFKHDIYQGEAYAIQMNNWIFKMLAEPKKSEFPIYQWKQEFWLQAIKDFLNKHLGTPRYNIAGKNVASFDMKFMPDDFNALFKHRVIDAGSVFVDWSKETLPDLGTIKKNNNISGEVTHNMLEDARDVIRCLRKTY